MTKINKIQVCIVCGIPWKDGKGFVGKHKFPCSNDAHGWNFVKEVDAVNLLREGK